MGGRVRRGAASQTIAIFCALLAGCGGTGVAPVSPEASRLGAAELRPALATRDQPVFVFTGPDIPGSSGPQNLFTSDLAGRGVQQLSDDEFPRFLPHFSPDGRRLVYGKFLSGGYGDPSAISVIVSYDFASRRETRLTSGGKETQAVWSPDGKRIAYGTISGNALWLMNADGSRRTVVGRPSGAPDDQRWDDFLWSPDNWIYFTVGQTVHGCFKVRIDRIRPNGTGRARITDGGPSCTPPGFEQSGDADPGISPDGKTIYSSRGLPRAVPGLPNVTIRHLYKFSSDPYVPGKPEIDLSRGAKNDCVAGVPKVSPNGQLVALFLLCPTDPQHRGITLTDPDGTAFRFVETGFGADWNPRRGN